MATPSRQNQIFKKEIIVRCISFESSTLFTIPSETISNLTIEFLKKNGFNAISGNRYQMGLGATAFSVQTISLTMRFIATVAKIYKASLAFIESLAKTQRESILPNLILRLEVIESGRNTKFPNDGDLHTTKLLLASVKQISEIIDAEFPLFNISYQIVAPKGEIACFNIHFAKNSITDLTIMKLINKLPKYIETQKCNIQIKNAWYWPWGRMKISERSESLLIHHMNCRMPQYKTKGEYMLLQPEIKYKDNYGIPNGFDMNKLPFRIQTEKNSK